MNGRANFKQRRVAGLLLVAAVLLFHPLCLRRGDQHASPSVFAVPGVPKQSLLLGALLASSCLSQLTGGLPAVAHGLEVITSTPSMVTNGVEKIVPLDRQATTIKPSTRLVEQPWVAKHECHGAEVGDVLGLRYAAAYEVTTVDPKKELPEAEVDLIREPQESRLWTIFESSSARTGGRPFTIVLGDSAMIPGLESQVTGMCLGEQRVVYIPHQLAYGDGKKASVDFEGMTIPYQARLRVDVKLEELTSSNENNVGNWHVDGELIQ